MNSRNSMKNAARNIVKNKLKKHSRKLLLRIMVPWGLIFLFFFFLLSAVIGSFQKSFESGQVTDTVTDKQNAELSEYLTKKVNDANGKLQDFYEFDKELVLKEPQVKAYMKYLESQEMEKVENESDIHNPDKKVELQGVQMSKVDKYKHLIDKACNDLKPKFEYKKDVIKTTKKYQERVFEFTSAGSGLYDNSKSPVDPTALQIVKSLPNIDFTTVNQQFYVIGKGTYEVQESDDSTDGGYGWVYDGGTWWWRPLPTQKVKEYVYVSPYMPSRLSNVQVFNDSSSLPPAKEANKEFLYYLVNENRTVYVTSKLVPKEEVSKQEIHVLTHAENIENTWDVSYKIETTTTTTTEPGIEGNVTITVERPIVSERKTSRSPYDKLKDLIKNSNEDEDYEMIIAMIKFADDTQMTWFFRDPNDASNLTPVPGGGNCPPEYVSIFNEVGLKMGVPPWILMGIAQLESNFDMNAVSSAGAYGIMQCLRYGGGEDIWAYYLRIGLKTELENWGYHFGSADEGWTLFRSSAKVQIITGCFEFRHYLNYVLWKQGKTSSLDDSKSATTMAMIPWESSNVQDYRDLVRRALVCYNMGEGPGMTANLDSNFYANTVWNYAMQYKGSNSLVEFAKKFIGTPYVYGGTTPSGFDCSGFVQYVYAHCGCNLPRTSEEQMTVGKDVGMNDLMPGDLVFFDTTDKTVNTYPSHVGMYIGGGQFIHAPHTGDVVKVSNIKDGYYSTHFIKGKRFF